MNRISPSVLPAATRGACQPQGGETSGAANADGGGPGRPREWLIVIPPGTPLITSNQRMTWQARHRKVSELRGTTRQLLSARYREIPRGLDRADIRVEYTPPPRNRKARHPLAGPRIDDAANIHPSGKAIVDEIVAAGILPSDQRRRVRDETYHLLPDDPAGRGWLQVRITEVPR
jgi:hypothetical protein